MKNIVLTLLVTVILIVIFSTVSFPEYIPPDKGGIYMKHSDDEGVVIPGDGSEPVEIIIQTESQQTTEQEPTEESTGVKESEESNDSSVSNGKSNGERIVFKIIITKDLVVSFLCGAAAVLILEAIMHKEREKHEY